MIDQFVILLPFERRSDEKDTAVNQLKANPTICQALKKSQKKSFTFRSIVVSFIQSLVLHLEGSLHCN